MSRTLKIYIFFLVVLLGIVIYIDAVRPKPVDWRPSYIIKDKVPFGLYVFDQEAENVLGGTKIKKINNTFYEFLDRQYDYDNQNGYKIKGTLMNICDEYVIDDESTNEMFYFVSHGNTAFLSVQHLPKIFTDSLKIKLESAFNIDNKTDCWLANTQLGNQKYDLSKGAGTYFFSSFDTLTTTVLGYQGTDANKKVNFIKIPYKKGNFIIHLQPVAFTNYHLLKDNHADYASKVLSYVPKGDLFWFTKAQTGISESGSPFRYILSQPALRYAWYTFLIGIVVFMIFNAKRRQRVIPIIKPLPNTTVDFTKTIGNLYYQEGNHQNLIDKKIIYFLERVRNEYLIDTTVLDENFIKKLHLKTGKDLKDIEHLVYLINYQRKSYHQSIESDLIEINNAIEKIIN
ncbi:DUF4350 domain-containing protein [Flavobacterium sedimenticola]|uniref:DUF4350 domain-containing protein n=1 Tax=Flavobacterium sedimenticola TaxID=3043286 RepID=A0ABT6XT25_9FLAO|nr:DUF4350 domain-containing protein [Flavobacterium sedimenticola]MDI9258248.1 DUF4350 domain-containing protein [Flavobacterium sedimenticola]